VSRNDGGGWGEGVLSEQKAQAKLSALDCTPGTRHGDRQSSTVIQDQGGRPDRCDGAAADDRVSDAEVEVIERSA